MKLSLNVGFCCLLFESWLIGEDMLVNDYASIRFWLWIVTLFIKSSAQFNPRYYFPDDFKFGVSTSSYQIEGAWNVSDKSESIWDRASHTPGKIADNSTGDVACDSYRLYKTDIQMMKYLGIDTYRFSVSWPRILPEPNKISKDGAAYYNTLIDELLANNIEPIVTMHHSELPQKIQDLGGWTNPLIVDWFVDYAKVLFRLFANRVKYWGTINEGSSICNFGYGSKLQAPYINQPAYGEYMCNRHILLAHAKVWHLYNDKYKPVYNGKVGIANHVAIFIPGTDSEQDRLAAADANDLYIGRFSHPLFTNEGGWPPRIKNYVDTKSKLQGFPRSRLPDFSNDEIKLMKGAADFYGVNHYLPFKAVRKLPANLTELDIYNDIDVTYFVDPSWKVNTLGWPIYPKGFRKALVFVKEKYNNPQILITENGFGSTNSSLEDNDRVSYYRDYLEQVLLAIYEDGCRVTHYHAWSLMDNFEWSSGYGSKFGLYHVDMADPERARTPRKSAHVYKQIVKAKRIDYDCNETV